MTHFSMWMTDWLHQRIWYDCRECLTPSLGFIIGWGSGKLREDGRDNLLPLTCGGDPFRSSVQVADDRGETRLTGPTAYNG